MTSFIDSPRLPTIDLSLFDLGDPWRDHVAAQIDWAATEFGIFRIIGHGVDRSLVDSLVAWGGRYFSREDAAARREDLSFDEAFMVDDGHSSVSPSGISRDVLVQLPGFRDCIRDYMTALTGLGHRLMTSFSRGLRLGDNYFVDRYTSGAAIQFRIAQQSGAARPGLLTILNHDESSGLEVQYGERLIETPYVPGALICSVDDLLSRLTAGRYARAHYRVVSGSRHPSLALPFSFGPRIDAALTSIAAVDPRTARWHPPAVTDLRVRERAR